MAELESVRWAVEALKFVKERKAELKDVEDQARDAIEQAMGDDSEGTLDGHVAVTWKHFKRTALDQKLLKTSYPEVAALCMSTTETRRFQVED